MGGQESKLVEEEKVKWATRHSLEIDQQLKQTQLPLVQLFGNRLYMFQMRESYMGIIYMHFYVTDNTWTIEFSGSEFSVQIHNSPKKPGAQLVKETVKTSAIVERMEKVCGARGYSLALRNCEHLARYIFSGSWISLQMLKGADLSVCFLRHMMEKQQLMINTFPEELRGHDQSQVPVYPNVRPFLSNFRRCCGLAVSDNDAFNVLLVGPTGCGKSHLINLFYNRKVCESNASAASVTKTIDITSGQAQIMGQMRKVNIIDTIGFCDTDLTSSEVMSLIKDKVKLNFMYIDMVVVMCSGRVEKLHADAAKQVMNWLKYSEYVFNFTFIYGKADLVPEDEREANLALMCEKLETGHIAGGTMRLKRSLLPSFVRAQAPLTEEVVEKHHDPKIHCGLNPGAAFKDVEDELARVLDKVFMPTFKNLRSLQKMDYSIENQKRIPLEESWCSIL